MRAHERGVSTVGAVLLAAVAGLLTAMLFSDWMIVQVETPEPEAFDITVPVPLVAGRIAAAFVPDDAMEEAVVPPELKAQRETVLEALRALVEAPDATLVKVDADDAHVEVIKVGDELRVAVDADDATVRCAIPIDGVLEALEDWDWETFDPSLAFDILAAAGNGELVKVEVDDGTKVAIKMW